MSRKSLTENEKNEKEHLEELQLQSPFRFQKKTFKQHVFLPKRNGLGKGFSQIPSLNS